MYSIETNRHRKVPNIEPWLKNEPIASLELTEHTKAETSPDLFKARFNELREKYQGYNEIYTDGSKDPQNNTNGCAFVIPELKVSKGFKLQTHVNFYV